MTPLEVLVFYIIPRLVILLIFAIATIHTIDALVNQNEGAHRTKIKQQP